MMGGARPTTALKPSNPPAPRRAQPMAAPRTNTPPDLLASENPHDPGSTQVGRQTRVAKARLVFGSARGSNRMAPVVGALVCWLLWNTLDHGLLIGWFVLLALAAGWREAVERGFVRDEPANAGIPVDRCDFARVGAGLVYGRLGTVLRPRREPATASVLLATLVAAASAGMVVLLTSLRSTLVFALPVPIVALTANALDGDRLRSITAGMDEHRAKPFHEPALNTLLLRFLGPVRCRYRWPIDPELSTIPI